MWGKADRELVCIILNMKTQNKARSPAYQALEIQAGSKRTLLYIVSAIKAKKRDSLTLSCIKGNIIVIHQEPQMLNAIALVVVSMYISHRAHPLALQPKHTNIVNSGPFPHHDYSSDEK